MLAPAGEAVLGSVSPVSTLAGVPVARIGAAAVLVVPVAVVAGGGQARRVAREVVARMT